MEVNQKTEIYAPEKCGYCEGNSHAVGNDHLCPACQGKGTLLVHQPSIRCPRCAGNGRARQSDDLRYRSNLCVVCLGTGWVMTEFH
jgi:hypothetical protein